MKRIFFVLAIFPLLWSCHTNNHLKTIEGDVYVKLIDFRPFEADDSTIIKIERQIKSTENDTLPEYEQELYNTLGILMDCGLLREPFIRLHLDNGDLTMLFIEKTDFEKFENYDWEKLRDNDKKIHVKAKVTELTFKEGTIYKTKKLISATEVKGATEIEK